METAKKVLICQHGGSANHGCEALARTVIELLYKSSPNIDITLYSYCREEDKKYLADIENLHIPGLKSLPGKYSPFNISYHIKQVTKPGTASKLPITDEFKQLVAQADLVIAIGGDNYCYNKGRGYYPLDRYIKDQGKKYVLLGCSIEPDDLPGELARHLQLFDLISARESITYKALRNNGLYNIVYAPDSAFLLPITLGEMPSCYTPNNAVGINISPLIVKSEKIPGITLANFHELISSILQETDMQIALIPHVVWPNNDDRKILERLKQEFSTSGRVFSFADADACTLKGIISQLRFFIGARTHATIAAYSTAVPTLVVGYSIKAKGIATDLFGEYNDYVLPVQELAAKDDLKQAFGKLLAIENELHQHLRDILPQYKDKAASITYYLSKLINDQSIAEDLAENKPQRLTAQNLCCGCGLCADICPNKCLSMEANEEGFLYPMIDISKCSECGLCAITCPVNTAANTADKAAEQPLTYAAVSNNEQVRQDSSSGGIFSLLAQQILNQGGLVAGAAFDEDLQLKHILVDNIEDLGKLRGSKYLQSNLQPVYQLIAAALDEGKKVLFSGTPCQTAAIHNRFPHKDNLLLLSLICHGVPSPDVFKQYLMELADIYQSPVKSVNFRDKSQGWQNFCFAAAMENGQTYLKSLHDDSYMRLFLRNVSLRPSCHACFARGEHNIADITLADYWGIANYSNTFNDNLGCSLVLVGTDKGAELFSAISEQIKSEQTTMQGLERYNPCIFRSVEPHPARGTFFAKRKEKTLDQWAKQLFPPPTPKQKLIASAKKLARKILR